MSSVTSLPVTIAKATEADIPALAEINTTAYLPQPFLAFFFPDWPNVAPVLSFFTARIIHSLKDPSTEVYKIVDSGSNDILGFICMSLSEGNQSHHGGSNPAGDFEPPPGIGFNFEFAKACGEGLAPLEECVKDKKHFGRLPACDRDALR